MSVQILPLGPGLGRYAVERVAHVGAHVVVPVLVQAQRAARVLDEQVQQADLVLPDLGDGADDVVGHEVRAARPRRERELLLGPRHGRKYRWWWGCGSRSWRARSLASWGKEKGEWKSRYVVESTREKGNQEDKEEEDGEGVLRKRCRRCR